MTPNDKLAAVAENAEAIGTVFNGLPHPRFREKPPVQMIIPFAAALAHMRQQVSDIVGLTNFSEHPSSTSIHEKASEVCSIMTRILETDDPQRICDQVKDWIRSMENEEDRANAVRDIADGRCGLCGYDSCYCHDEE